MRKLASLLGLALLVVGCGGGGGAPSSSGGGGGGVLVTAGPLRIEGQVKGPDTAVISGLTGYSLTGNVTTCVYSDINPTLTESEVLYSRIGPNGYEIVGANLGDGSVRSIVAQMPQNATSLRCDPSGRWVYYIRNANLQRTDIRDGTSNTIVAGVQSFAFDEAGTQLFYRKSTSTQLWKCALNGSGQTLVGDYPAENPEVLGMLTSTIMACRSLNEIRAFKLLDTTTGVMSTWATFIGQILPQWTAYNAREKCIYNSYYWSAAPAGTEYRIERWALATPTGGLSQQWTRQSSSSLGVNGATGGPDPRTLVGWEPARATTFDPSGATSSALPMETAVFGAYWNAARTNLQLVGAGTPFPTGVGGVIVTELYARNPSIVVADGVSRNTVTITSLNDSPNGNLIYRIDCDNLSKLSYAMGNGYAWRHLITAATGLKGAVVSFESFSGKVNSIVTFSKKPVVSRVGTQWKVEGDLVDVFDGKTGAKRPASPSVMLK